MQQVKARLNKTLLVKRTQTPQKTTHATYLLSHLSPVTLDVFVSDDGTELELYVSPTGEFQNNCFKQASCSLVEPTVAQATVTGKKLLLEAVAIAGWLVEQELERGKVYTGRGLTEAQVMKFKSDVSSNSVKNAPFHFLADILCSSYATVN